MYEAGHLAPVTRQAQLLEPPLFIELPGTSGMAGSGILPVSIYGSPPLRDVRHLPEPLSAH
jgi:hypothetical protein